MAPSGVNTHNGDPLPPLDAKPSTDIAAAIQFARQNAPTLQIDPSNIFIASQSRGSLSLLTALMADQKKDVLDLNDPPYLLQSSKPNAVFSANSQVTSDDAEIENLFIEHRSMAKFSKITSNNNRAIEYSNCKSTVGGVDYFDYWCHYDNAHQPITNPNNVPLSALQALNDDNINVDGRPIWLRYDRNPNSLNNTQAARVALYVNDAGTDQNAANIDNNLYCFEGNYNCLDVHHPNYGAVIVSRYKTLKQNKPSTKTYIYAEYGGAPFGPGTAAAQSRDNVVAQFFMNYYCIFLKYKTADGGTFSPITTDGNKARVKAIQSFNTNHAFGVADEDADKCYLSELEPWSPFNRADDFAKH